MAKRVKDLVFSLQGLSSQLWYRVDPWPYILGSGQTNNAPPPPQKKTPTKKPTRYRILPFYIKERGKYNMLLYFPYNL